MAEKYSFLVVKYPMAETADAALAVLLELAKQKVVKFKDVVAISKGEKGKIKLHQTKDDTAGMGLLKGGMIGLLFAALFGPVGWVAAGAALGTAFALFDRGIKNKLLKELGENMSIGESAVAMLIESADWQKAFEKMQSYDFHGKVVVSEIVAEDMPEVERLLENPQAVATVPVEMDLTVPAAEAVAAEETVEAAPEAGAPETAAPEAPEAEAPQA